MQMDLPPMIQPHPTPNESSPNSEITLFHNHFNITLMSMHKSPITGCEETLMRQTDCVLWVFTGNATSVSSLCLHGAAMHVLHFYGFSAVKVTLVLVSGSYG